MMASGFLSVVREELERERRKSLTQGNLSDFTGYGNDILGRILLLLEKGEAERSETLLLDVMVVGQILVAASMHIILAEVLTVLMHG